MPSGPRPGVRSLLRSHDPLHGAIVHRANSRLELHDGPKAKFTSPSERSTSWPKAAAGEGSEVRRAPLEVPATSPRMRRPSATTPPLNAPPWARQRQHIARVEAAAHPHGGRVNEVGLPKLGLFDPFDRRHPQLFSEPVCLGAPPRHIVHEDVVPHGPREPVERTSQPSGRAPIITQGEALLLIQLLDVDIPIAGDVRPTRPWRPRPRRPTRSGGTDRHAY